MSLSVPIHLTVNGIKRGGFAEPRKTLADFLRDDLGLTGTHIGCEHGMCGACTLIVNGDAVRSCLMLAVQARDAEVLTIEGLAHDSQLHPIQEAMRESHGFQCGFCAPGFVMATYALLAETPRPTETAIREALSGNLCRCTGYQSIIEGVQLAAEKIAALKPATPLPPSAATPQPTPGHRDDPVGRKRAAIATNITSTHWAVTFSKPADAPTAPGGAGTPTPKPVTSLVGTPQLRVEDTRMLTGRTCYVNDISLPGMLHAAFLRSPHPHAAIVKIDMRHARALPGVVAVYTSAEIRTFTNPMQLAGGPEGFKTPVYYPLAADKVRYVGDPVALVIAESRAVAEDACEAIDVTYSALPAVSTLEQALDPAKPPVFQELGDNVLYVDSATYGDVNAAFAQADRVVKETFRQHRYAPVPLETRGGVASFDPPSGELTYHVAAQSPHAIRFFVGELINQPLHRMRVVAHDIGGSFGLKWFVHREDVAICAVSKQLGRPVKWIEDRREHLMASGHAREETLEIEAAVKNDGTVLGLRAKITMNQGAYPALPFPSPLFPTMVGIMLPGPYRFGAMSFDNTVVASNKASYVAYRGPWEMETWTRERLLDVIARELNIDPVEIRRKNIVTKDQQPTKMLTGPSLNNVTAKETLERAVALMDYQGFRAQQIQDRAQGRYRGIGFATFIEPAPGPRDGMSMGAKWGASAGLGGLGGDRAHLRIEPDGSLSILTAQTPHGQSHETTLAQVAADELGIPFESVKVLYGDTLVSPFSVIGTGGSRASTMAAGAAVMAARALKKMILDVAATMLQANVDDLVLANGLISVKGVPEKTLPLAQLAMMAYMAPASLPPPGVTPGLEVTLDYDGGEGGWSQSTHACIVEVDPETGVVRIERYQVVEDCGTVINPAVVEGQVRGGTAQGIGGVLLEHAIYDDQGYFLAPTFHEYLLPTCVEIPAIAVDELQTQLANPLSARGVGESGAIGAPAALTNAIFDALAPLKVGIVESSMTPTRILELTGAIPIARPAPSAAGLLSAGGAPAPRPANVKPRGKKSSRG